MRIRVHLITKMSCYTHLINVKNIHPPFAFLIFHFIPLFVTGPMNPTTKFSIDIIDHKFLPRKYFTVFYFCISKVWFARLLVLLSYVCFVSLTSDFYSIILLKLVAVVDDVYTDHSHIAGKFTMLSSSRVYVGGSVNPRALLGARVHNNFVGCLRKVHLEPLSILKAQPPIDMFLYYI